MQTEISVTLPRPPLAGEVTEELERMPVCRRSSFAGLAVAALVLLTGCQLSQLSHLQFTKDNRLTFISPTTRELVKTVPLTISWRMSGFTPTGLDGSKDSAHGVYAVFVDKSPIKIGENLSAVGSGDSSCRHDQTHLCESDTYLHGKFVYTTKDTSVTVPYLPQVAQGVGDEQHTVAVVLLDGTGTRRTESAWFVNFRFPRRKF